MRFVSTLMLLTLGLSSTALAQNAEWVVVPMSSTEGTEWMQPTVGSMGSALAQERVRVMSPERAVANFEKRGSSSSTQVSDTDIDEWVTRSRQAIRYLARGDYSAALRELKEAQVISRKAVDELNREQHRAQNVLDTCLYLVRALLETGNRTRAKAQAQECVQLVPRGEPNPHMHPPSVISLYKQAGDVDPDETGSLVVTSEPSQCPVRINGLRFGQTPFEMAGLYPGEYQVQVECDPDGRGRVHPVTVRTGKAELFVDFAFDSAIRTTPVLHLRYDEKPEGRRPVRDAQQIAKVLRPGAVVLASVPSVEIMELRVISGTERHAGVVRIPTTARGPTSEMAAAAAKALARGECTDFTGAKPVPMSCGTGAAASSGGTKTKDGWPADRPPRGQWISGLALTSAGAASLLAGYTVLIMRRSEGVDMLNTYDPSDATNRVRWTNLGNALGPFALAGGVLSTAGLPLVLPYRSKTPWWAWLSGGIGVGFTVAAIVSGVTAKDVPSGANRCQNLQTFPVAQDCVDRERSIDRAIMFAATAAPTLTMPLVYLLRKDSKKRDAQITPNLSVGRNGGFVSVSGAF